MGIEQRMGKIESAPRTSFVVNPELFKALEAKQPVDMATLTEIPLKKGEFVVAMDGKGRSFVCEIGHMSEDGKKMTLWFHSEQAH
mgnify:CR=1 FL=1